MQNSIKHYVGNFWHDARGATAIEYALIGSLIAVVIIGSLMLLNGSMAGLYEEIQGAIVPAIDQAQGAQP